MVSFLGTKDSLRGCAAISNGVNGLSSDAAIHHRWVRRRRAYLLYMMIFLAMFVFAMSSMVMQTLIGSVFGSESLMMMRRLRLGSSLRFMRSHVQDDGLDWERSSKPRMALRPPQIAFGNEYSTLVQIAAKWILQDRPFRGYQMMNCHMLLLSTWDEMPRDLIFQGD